MNNWHPEIEQFLSEQKYNQIVNFYEQLVENNPENITNYVYLGLAYLLQEKEEEAQLTWFMVLNQQETQEEIDSATQELTKILDIEALRQENQENYKIAWLIRGHIKELQPNNLTNLMALIRLEAILKYSVSTTIKDCGIIELLTAENTVKLSEELIIKTLDKVLYIISDETLDFARSCLIYSRVNPDILGKIYQTSKIMGFNYRYVNYAIELLLVCKEFISEKSSTYIDLHELYLLQENYKKAVEIINILWQESESFEDKLLATCYLLNTYPKLSDWNQVYQIADNLNRYCEKIIREKVILKSLSVKNYFYQTLINFLYLKDDLVFHRYLFKNISVLWEASEPKKDHITYTHTKEIKTLKIGYIGTTFRTHSVGFLCRWLIHHHNLSLYEINIYSVITNEDEITQWFKPLKVNQFYDGKGDVNRLVDKINADEINILVDIDSLTSSLTASVLLQKPAPIQVTWLGLDASSLSTIDYYIADPYVLEKNADRYYTEKIWRLPQTYLSVDGFEIGLPSLRREDLGIDNGSIVFMNLQHSKKLNPNIIRSQIKIIKAIPNSYFLIKETYDYKALSNFITQIAESENVSMSKVIFIPPEPLNITHRANLKIADVMLDTYPYNGATTTLETLWMEIPIVTRVGEQFAARNSYTFMMNAGITEGIAWSDEEYVEWGIKLGTDENLRKEISWKLRQSKKTSPLWNGKQFTREMEKAYQQMWEIYVDEKNLKNTEKENITNSRTSPN